MKEKGWNRILRTNWRYQRSVDRETEPHQGDVSFAGGKMRPNNKVHSTPEKKAGTFSMASIRQKSSMELKQTPNRTNDCCSLKGVRAFSKVMLIQFSHFAVIIFSLGEKDSAICNQILLHRYFGG